MKIIIEKKEEMKQGEKKHKNTFTSTTLLLVLSILLSSSLTMDLMSALALCKSSGFLLCSRRCRSRDFSSSSKTAFVRGRGSGAVGAPMYGGSSCEKKSGVRDGF